MRSTEEFQGNSQADRGAAAHDGASAVAAAALSEREQSGSQCQPHSELLGGPLEHHPLVVSLSHTNQAGGIVT